MFLRLFTLRSLVGDSPLAFHPFSRREHQECQSNRHGDAETDKRTHLMITVQSYLLLPLGIHIRFAHFVAIVIERNDGKMIRFFIYLCVCMRCAWFELSSRIGGHSTDRRNSKRKHRMKIKEKKTQQLNRCHFINFVLRFYQHSDVYMDKSIHQNVHVWRKTERHSCRA